MAKEQELLLLLLLVVKEEEDEAREEEQQNPNTTLDTAHQGRRERGDRSRSRPRLSDHHCFLCLKGERGGSSMHTQLAQPLCTEYGMH